jgi:hypothetical protein
MQRGIYFDAWFPRQHCYHPSLPPRRLTMVEDLVAYRATTLVWSALGGGSISLPYLEQEAFGEVDARSRMYGFVNDSEFIAACQEHGIQVFGIVFEVQGWEFPAELSDDEDAVLALNELRGAGTRGWLGLREFWQHRYPRIWESPARWFPDGLRDGRGRKVENLLEECCSRDIHGTALHARWVEAPDREHECYLMDRNHPAWREYLKAVVRLQIDAGVDGVQLDEAELPLTALQYGGCFCDTCMDGFRAYLQAIPEGARPDALDGVDLSGFHYGRFLLERGFDFKQDQPSSPLFRDYLRYQRASIARTFAEVAEHARSYAREQGREVLVSGNFFNLFDQYHALEPHVDLIITEMRNTAYRQPAWYRYVAGFAAGKPTIVVENPYGGVVPDLLERLRAGRGHDLFRLSLYEAAAHGVNMSVPYGAWLGSVVHDSLWVPHELCVEIQAFLEDHATLISPDTACDLCLVYSVESAFRADSEPAELADNRRNVIAETRTPFWEAAERLADARQPFDVVLFPDGALRPDAHTLDDLRRYRTLVLPDCTHLTGHQASLLEVYLHAGGRLLVLGGFGENLGAPVRDALLQHPGTTRTDDLDVAGLPVEPQLRVDPDADVSAIPQRIDGGIAVHVLHYAHDDQADRVPSLDRLVLELRLPPGELYSRVESHAPGSEPEVQLEVLDGGVHRISLRDAPLYTIVELAN